VNLNRRSCLSAIHKAQWKQIDLILGRAIRKSQRRWMMLSTLRTFSALDAATEAWKQSISCTAEAVSNTTLFLQHSKYSYRNPDFHHDHRTETKAKPHFHLSAINMSSYSCRDGRYSPRSCWNLEPSPRAQDCLRVGIGEQYGSNGYNGPSSKFWHGVSLIISLHLPC
jgi:hypothetical protein